MGPSGVGETHVTHELQTCKVQVLVLKKGKITDRFRFRLVEYQIPSVTERPVKSLGKVFNCRLKDRDSIKANVADLEGWLRTVDKSRLPGRFKAFVYQHGILPRILWPLLIYKVPMTVIEGFEQKVSSYLCRWLGLPRSLSNIELYGNTNKLRLHFSSVRKEFIVAQAREHLQYSGSRDNNVSGAGIIVRTGRKWRAAEAVQQAETRLKHLVPSLEQWRKVIPGHAAARRLDEVGAGDGAECHMEGHMEVEPPEDQVLDSGGLWCPPKSIQPVHMGQNRNTCMPPLFQSRDIRTHPEQLLQGAGWGPVSMEARPGPQIHRWGNQQGDQGQLTHPSYSQGHPLHQGRTKARESSEKLLWRFALYSPGLGNDS